uniref:F-box domain-containing protein n=1 Tax=Mycena chlorophos TaxID=658473 RepID=A0ABQ0LWP0_MYCCL|nr:predicted protein [Mycena chlorophos]
MATFPNETWTLIFSQADPQTLLELTLVSRLFHALSINVLIRHLVWKSPDRAEAHMSAFWAHNPGKERSVRSLKLQFLAQWRPWNELHPGPHRYLFAWIRSFDNLRSFHLCAVNLPEDFFELLDCLPHLRRIVLRQCVVPAPPEQLRSPPPIESMFLVQLRTRATDDFWSYSPYFVHLFPHIPSLSLDRYPYDVHLKLAPACAHVALTLGPTQPDPYQNYFAILPHFQLQHLERLVIISPLLYYLPFPIDPSTKDVSLELPRLQTVVAPFRIVLALVRMAPNLTSVAVQGTLSSTLAFRVVNRLRGAGHPLRSLAIDLAAWDESVIPYICAQLPGLESLEILYHQCMPSKASLPFIRKQYKPSDHSLAVLGDVHLPKMASLTTFHLHAFPLSRYDDFPWIHYGSHRYTPPLPRTSPTYQSRLADVHSVAHASRSLRRVKLRHDTEKRHGWVRADDQSQWYEAESNGILCTSAPKPAEPMLWGPLEAYIGAV